MSHTATEIGDSPMALTLDNTLPQGVLVELDEVFNSGGPTTCVSLGLQSEVTQPNALESWNDGR